MTPKTKYWMIRARSVAVLCLGILAAALLLREDLRTASVVTFLATLVASLVVWAAVDVPNVRRLSDE